MTERMMNSRPTLLDCENLETASRSLCGLFRCSLKDLHDILRRIDIDRVYEQDEPDCTPDQFLHRNLVSALGEPHRPQDVCWFHLTRTSRCNRFTEGILPLGMALDAIWETLLAALRGSEHFSRLQDMRREGVSSYHYNLKTLNPFHWGPFAMRVRDVAFVPERLPNHDYLRLPEIVEDICNGYRSKYGISIQEEVVGVLVPCIVKFVVRGNSDAVGVGPAIHYVYRGIRGEPVSPFANTCFDARGKVIPESDILKIEYIESP